MARLGSRDWKEKKSMIMILLSLIFVVIDDFGICGGFVMVGSSTLLITLPCLPFSHCF